MKKNRQGFTLIELMIVVAIIAIISSIAIPNLLRSRMNASENAAIGDLKAIGTAQISYNTVHGEYADFGELTADNPPFLDNNWFEGCVRAGYIFTMPVATTDYFEIYAEPVVPGRSGERYFRIDATGAIRFSTAGAPDDSAETVGAF